jgi:hypothetical protein
VSLFIIEVGVRGFTYELLAHKDMIRGGSEEREVMVGEGMIEAVVGFNEPGHSTLEEVL